MRQIVQHSMVLLEVSEDWREYLIYLEEEFSRIVSIETCEQELD